jgi:hypothetical protein
MSDQDVAAQTPQFVVTVEGDVYGEDTPESREIVRRIHACVNACAGITTEELENGIIDDLRRMVNNIVPLLQDKRDAIESVLNSRREQQQAQSA